MKMSDPLQQTLFPAMELDGLMSSRVGSHAKTLAMPESAQGLAKEPDQGYSPKSSALLASYDRNSSSWRTLQLCFLAQAKNEADGLAEFSESWPRSGTMHSGIAYRRETLAHPTSEIVSGFWLTSAGMDWKCCGAPSEVVRKSQTLGSTLLAPTPRKSRGYTAYSTVGFAPSLTEWITGHRGAGTNGLKPNPSFVEWMMGFPIEWGVLPPAATPLSRKSPK